MASPSIIPSVKAALEDYLDRMKATYIASPRNPGLLKGAKSILSVVLHSGHLTKWETWAIQSTGQHHPQHR
jgi:hypothetical protein